MPTTHCQPRRAALFRGVICLSAAALGWGVMGVAMAQSDAVTLEQAREALSRGRATVLDVREPMEHANGIAPGAKPLPRGQLAAQVATVVPDKQQAVLLICHTQNRSRLALQTMKALGYTNVRYVEGGMSGWMQNGWTVVKP